MWWVLMTLNYVFPFGSTTFYRNVCGASIKQKHLTGQVEVKFKWQISDPPANSTSQGNSFLQKIWCWNNKKRRDLNPQTLGPDR